MSTEYSLLAAMLARCQDISIANGYLTDVGLSAQIESPRFNPDEVTSAGVLAIFDDAEEAGDIISIHTGDYQNSMDITVEAHIRVGANNAVTMAHNMISDIKKAVLLASDLTVSGLVLWLRFVSRETEYPNPDGDVVSVKLNFQALFIEVYGDP